jgi:hypothetical protein
MEENTSALTNDSPPDVAHVAHALEHGDDPASFAEATRCPDADHWWQAMREEIDMLTHKKTWELVQAPPDCNIIGCRWTYLIKRGPNGEITRYKARLVAQGFSQVYGVDYDETFAPTV